MKPRIKYYIIFISLLILILFAFFHALNGSYTNKDENLLFLSEKGMENNTTESGHVQGNIDNRRIEISKVINPDKAGQRVEKIISIPYRFAGCNSSLRFSGILSPLVFNRETGKYYFYSYIGDQRGSNLFFCLNDLVNAKNPEEKFLFVNTTCPPEQHPLFPSSITSSGDMVITWKGESVAVEQSFDNKDFYREGWSFKIGNNDVCYDKAFETPVSGLLIDDNRIVIQAPSKTSYSYYYDATYSKNKPTEILTDNSMILFDLKNHSTLTIKSGYNPVPSSYNPELFLPVDYSAERNSIAFFAKYEDQPGKPSKLWLSCWNLDNNSINKLVKIPVDKEDVNALYMGNTILKWSQSKTNSCIAFVIAKQLHIYDIAKDKIICEQNITRLKNARWSEDGNNLAFVDVDSLYIYNIKENKLSKLHSEYGIFDLIWSKSL